MLSVSSRDLWAMGGIRLCRAVYYRMCILTNRHLQFDIEIDDRELTGLAIA